MAFLLQGEDLLNATFPHLLFFISAHNRFLSLICRMHLWMLHLVLCRQHLSERQTLCKHPLSFLFSKSEFHQLVELQCTFPWMTSSLTSYENSLPGQTMPPGHSLVIFINKKVPQKKCKYQISCNISYYLHNLFQVEASKSGYMCTHQCSASPQWQGSA